jgi:SWIM zinc finger
MSSGPLASAMLAAAVAGRADPARFGRGRAYVRDGAVVELDVAPGVLSGAVIGSSRTPYRVTVRVDNLTGPAPLTPDTARELNQLVPQPQQLHSTCSCPDGADPCKHAVALLLAFAQQIAIQPQLLGTWRGRSLRVVPSPTSDPPAAPSTAPPAVASRAAADFLGDPDRELPALPDLEPLALGVTSVVANVVADALALIQATYREPRPVPRR